MTLRRKILIISILSSVAFLATLGLLEIGARVLGFRGDPGFNKNKPRIPHAERGWAYKPHLKFSFLGTEGWVEGTTDGEGFRPTIACADKPDSPIVFCIGDSTTANAECPDDKTWPEAASNALLRAGIPCRMVNRGIRAYSTLQSLATLREALRDDRRAAQTRAVVYYFCGNDPNDNVDSTRPRYDSAQFKDGVPALREGPLSIVVPPREAWDKESVGKGRVWERSALFSFIRFCNRPRSAAAFKTGTLEWLAHFNGLAEGYNSRPMEQATMKVAMEELARECRSRKIPLLVCCHPIPPWQGDPRAQQEVIDLCGLSPEKLKSQADSYRSACDRVRRIAEEAGATFIPLAESLNGLSYREYAFSPSNFHLSARANQRIGETIAAAVRPVLERGGK